MRLIFDGTNPNEVRFREDLAKLNYTTCFIKESMRMHTPVPAITRKLSEPVTVEGVEFPSGTVIDLHPHLLHHHPDVWEDHMVNDVHTDITIASFKIRLHTYLLTYSIETQKYLMNFLANINQLCLYFFCL